MAAEEHGRTDSPSITERVPGMRPGETARNIGVGYGYFLLALVAVLFFPLALGIIVGNNYAGAAEKLSGAPGIDPSGGVKSGAIVAVVALFVWVPFIQGMEDPSVSNVESRSVSNIDEFEQALEDNGVETGYVGETEMEYVVGGDTVTGVDYYPQDPTNPHDEIRTIAIMYAELVDSTDGAISLIAVPVDSEGPVADGTSITSNLAQQYADGDISEEEYMDRVNSGGV
ncbi:hypothetical protein [Saliphagus sp. LR7]|uniref:hypothetical protein n=1 Tax=Saliphagus sp. LR7 TaxID=2282654 RepID=UPI00130023C1|nr:hypothetical protein [Saliphagus sp. LR7]